MDAADGGKQRLSKAPWLPPRVAGPLFIILCTYIGYSLTVNGGCTFYSCKGIFLIVVFSACSRNIKNHIPNSPSTPIRNLDLGILNKFNTQGRCSVHVHSSPLLFRCFIYTIVNYFELDISVALNP